ncbi:hypothetical protein NR352_24220 [Enterobacter soli]|uniref:hypothetical protein n=1 Tax=Enterobacter soli TaxID=885040 RepID=UPI00031D0755|nr:hypothetical protein [Enterobacter soli]MCR1320035.1 hypothetical protein [Enterobacter soli]
MYVVFCIPSAETIHQGLGAHYTLIFRQKENENSVSKIICADSHKIVINALRHNDNLWRQARHLPHLAQIFSA